MIQSTVAGANAFSYRRLSSTRSYISDLMCKYSLCSYYGKSQGIVI